MGGKLLLDKGLLVELPPSMFVARLRGQDCKLLVGNSFR